MAKLWRGKLVLTSFFLPRKNPKIDPLSDEAGYSPPTTESDLNSDQNSDQETERSEHTTPLDSELEIGSEKDTLRVETLGSVHLMIFPGNHLCLNGLKFFT